MALNAVPGLGNARIKKLIDRFGCAKTVFSSSAKDLGSSGIVSSEIVNLIKTLDVDDYLKQEAQLIKRFGTEVVAFTDEQYPKNLKEIPDCPVLLYCKGNISKLDHLAVAVVGSRKASMYGQATAEKLGTNLAELGIAVVSGMARGIDTCAHRGALKAKGITAAVLGCGLSHIYPPENKKLFDQIAEQGTVISEFSMATPPAAYHFPQRNRIISGLSLGVVVVEASFKSGALITSDFALEQGREVFAVPGKIDNPAALGVNRLIQQGAKLINGVEDIIEELKPHLQLPVERSIQKEEEKTVLHDPLDPKQGGVYRLLNKEPAHIDTLVDKTQFSLPQISSILLQLELKKLIKQLPGKFFVRIEK